MAQGSGDPPPNAQIVAVSLALVFFALMAAVVVYALLRRVREPAAAVRVGLYARGVRTMFATYAAIILAGILVYTVVGLRGL